MRAIQSRYDHRRPKIFGQQVLYDTGSNILTIPVGIAHEMNITRPDYIGNLGRSCLDNAAGTITRDMVLVRVCLGVEWSGEIFGKCFTETASIEESDTGGVDLLSGYGMRDQFCFATTEGNRFLLVGTTTEALIARLRRE